MKISKFKKCKVYSQVICISKKKIGFTLINFIKLKRLFYYLLVIIERNLFMSFLVFSCKKIHIIHTCVKKNWKTAMDFQYVVINIKISVSIYKYLNIIIIFFELFYNFNDIHLTRKNHFHRRNGRTF